DGSAIRDYIHVCDLAEAHVAAIGHLVAGGESLRLNLGTGSGHSVRAVIDAAERVTGRPITRREEPRRAGDPPVLVADPSRARETLGWTARMSDLDSILGTAWKWHTRPPGNRPAR
ncbi:MAG: UDP-glucose 4-epimerase, partial [Alphaproteobacteria bacterium]|nr:UDP-glucose 4-epimerase [Alphaproteobacteria bacterium]